VNALRCRVQVQKDGQPVDCSVPAAIGLVTEGEHGALELQPLCIGHAPEEVHEAAISMDRGEWALVSMAYGTADGELT
jgi:hypothetical protein